MLHNVANGQAPDLVMTWSAFSGLLDPQTIDATDWGERTKHPASKHSKSAFDITEFVGQEPTSPLTPMQHVVYQLTDAKVYAQPTPEGYQPPALPGPLLLPAVHKRKRDPDDDEHSTYAEDEDENGDDGKSGSG